MKISSAEVFRHGGNLRHLARMSGRRKEDITDFSANINPMGPPDWLRSVVSASLDSIVHYPDPDCTDLVAAVAVRYGAERLQVMAGNGSTEIIHLLPRALNIKRAVIPVPSYADYAAGAEAARVEAETFPLEEKNGFRLNSSLLAEQLTGGEMVFLCQPNNPTGLLMDAEELRHTADGNPATIFVVDEAFGDFVQGMDSLTSRRPGNVIVVLSLTKIFAIPGLRVGCAIADESVAAAVRRIQPCWSVNSVAQAVASAALKDTGFVVQSRAIHCRAAQRAAGHASCDPANNGISGGSQLSAPTH